MEKGTKVRIKMMKLFGKDGNQDHLQADFWVGKVGVTQDSLYNNIGTTMVVFPGGFRKGFFLSEMEEVD